jgi:hypothetical protein
VLGALDASGAGDVIVPLLPSVAVVELSLVVLVGLPLVAASALGSVVGVELGSGEAGEVMSMLYSKADPTLRPVPAARRMGSQRSRDRRLRPKQA